MNLESDIKKCDNLIEVIDTVEKSYVPNPLVPSYRRKSHHRALQQGKRIIEIRKYLTEGYPNWVTAALVSLQGETSYD